jgi:AbrB family looped-hinge helix DNA binding protein
MRVSENGRVTIPPKLRERYGLKPGARVELVASPDGVLIRALDGQRAPRDAQGANGADTVRAAFPLLTHWQ